MGWEKAIERNVLEDDQKHPVHIGDQKLLIFKQGDTIRAIEYACPHMRLPLTKGKLTENTITCPWHKSEFDLNTGDVKAWSPWPPVLSKLLGCVSRRKNLKVFPTKVEQGMVWVEF